MWQDSHQAIGDHIEARKQNHRQVMVRLDSHQNNGDNIDVTKTKSLTSDGVAGFTSS